MMDEDQVRRALLRVLADSQRHLELTEEQLHRRSIEDQRFRDLKKYANYQQLHRKRIVNQPDATTTASAVVDSEYLRLRPQRAMDTITATEVRALDAAQLRLLLRNCCSSLELKVLVAIQNRSGSDFLRLDFFEFAFCQMIRRHFGIDEKDLVELRRLHTYLAVPLERAAHGNISNLEKLVRCDIAEHAEHDREKLRWFFEKPRRRSDSSPRNSAAAVAVAVTSSLSKQTACIVNKQEQQRRSALCSEEQRELEKFRAALRQATAAWKWQQQRAKTLSGIIAKALETEPADRRLILEKEDAAWTEEEYSYLPSMFVVRWSLKHAQMQES